MAIKILWADDEIDLLRPHIMFLEQKGYEVIQATNGEDAIQLLEEHHVSIVFLDENMPGLTGLETLTKIKGEHPSLPVIMITKSEEEEIMEDAIGSKISDYLIKPVNPNQILLSIKKNLDTKRLVSEKTTSDYQRKFREIGMKITDRLDEYEWQEVYKEMVYWELEIDKSKDTSMRSIVEMQKEEANEQFSKFIKESYLNWIHNPEDAPTMSHKLFENRILPELEDSEGPVFLIVLDNLRYDQWKTLQPVFTDRFRVKEEDSYISILPTATQYARNAIFSGVMPSDIQRHYPQYWKNEGEEGSKNQFEKELLAEQLKRKGVHKKFSFHKVTNLKNGKKLVDQMHNLFNNDLNVIVYNFVDMLSHARTDMEVIRELADDESAYRSLTLSWLNHSPLYDIINQIADKKAKIILTTDHGSVKVQSPTKVVGDRNTNTNLRYKLGKNLNYPEKEVFALRKPQSAGLPAPNVTSSFIFATQDKFFAYPNNYNYYVNYFKNTFQHGGISLEEMVIPYIVLDPK